MIDADVIIIGGGLAGLVSAIHLRKEGKSVILIEKDAYPHHKVCGEYISNEVLPYLDDLDVNPSVLQPTRLKNFEMTTPNSAVIHSGLPLGGFGISRFALDHFLMKKALENGASILTDTVLDVNYDGSIFNVITKNQIYKSKLVIGAYGKRSTLDVKLNRTFIQQKSSWLAVKAHYSGNFPNDLVALHHFKGGYCGVSKVEDNLINICYLVNYASFKKYKNIQEHQKKVLYKNAHLKSILENCTMQFDAPLTISQISFEKKESVKNHILMVGDTAGLIHPLCGNGMGMAIHGAKIASTLIVNYLNGEISSLTQLEKQYTNEWKLNFKSRLKTGSLLSGLLRKEKLANFLINLIAKLPFLLPIIIKKTHGKPISLN
ncbi:NAD(P)/FAD-dependent oxidoreductase [Pedobacter changchengzhani]|uniref:NAD(P)/FAD-dependent oxidoreductase n=1 Tax=Pedobacter changchengzhani TaxID=2529274 RepID=A0A4R5MJJ3_9SPHI|nr:NAD(P)/FAD-dependent oxidoreductase [Pedobacter changchengzhani]TDG35249.1 NAD(P)/FAD-dependent oxidoreductase [Pedobacter changchengzhani]